MKKSEVFAWMKARGLRPLKRFGQHFLVDQNLLEAIVVEGRLGRGDVVLEVGTGVGNLTEAIARRAARVVTVEIDHGLAALARERLGGLSGVTVVEGDALDSKEALNPAVVEALREALSAAGQGASLKAVANLPYNIATPLILALLESPLPFARMVFTIQREVADRLVAHPGSGEYGVASVLAQTLATVSLARKVPPTCFWPAPNVESAVVTIAPRRPGEGPDARYPMLKSLTEQMFRHRRKTARNALRQEGPCSLGAEEADAALAAAGAGREARCEELAPEAIARMAEAVASLQYRDDGDP